MHGRRSIVRARAPAARCSQVSHIHIGLHRSEWTVRSCAPFWTTSSVWLFRPFSLFRFPGFSSLGPPDDDGSACFTTSAAPSPLRPRRPHLPRLRPRRPLSARRAARGPTSTPAPARPRSSGRPMRPMTAQTASTRAASSRRPRRLRLRRRQLLRFDRRLLAGPYPGRLPRPSRPARRAR